MKVLIKTGFEKVTHSVQFNLAGEPKGKDLVESGHVRDVCEHRQDGNSYLIEAKVIKQNAVTSPPYTTKLHINDQRHIVHVSYTCCYKQSQKCKHIAPLIHFINNTESRSKTDIEQQWGGIIPLQFAKEKYAKGKNFYEKYKTSDESKEKIESKQTIHEITDKGLEAPSAFKMMFTLMSERLKNNKNSNQDKNVIVNAELKVVELEKARIVNCLEQLFAHFEKQDTQFCSSLAPQQLEIYNRTIVLTKQKIVELCCETVKQSDKSDWFKARRLRVSASKSAHNIKCKKTKTIHKLIGEMLHPLKVDNAATRKNKESVARSEYEFSTGTCVQKLGVLICKSKPWLCASLDGVVMQNSQPINVIEIKCPATCEKLPIFGSDTKKINVNYLELKITVLL